jgi:hypothetical protein
LQLDAPIMKQTGIDIETGQSVKIAVTPELLNTTNVSYSHLRLMQKLLKCVLTSFQTINADLQNEVHSDGATVLL